MSVRRAFFSVSVGGQDVTPRFAPRLISVSITKSSTEATQSAAIMLDDGDEMIRFPKTGAPVSIRLGWEGGFLRRFEGEVDKADWSLDRSGGAQLSITARSVSLKGRVKQPADRHWENATLGQVLQDAAGEAGLSISVHADLASRPLAYEAQDNESFFSFARRLADEHGATFAISGTRAGFVPRDRGVSASGAALPTITVQRGVNLISADGLTPSSDRPRFKTKKGRWYDLQRARQVIETVQTNEDVEPEDVLRLMEPDAETATTRARSDAQERARQKGGGTVVIDGEPQAEPEGRAALSGVRPGVDGLYTIASVTDTLDRGSGYTTQMVLGNPQGAAGNDDR